MAAFKEIFYHETISQSSIFAMEIIDFIVDWPGILIFDDGCSLKNI